VALRFFGALWLVSRVNARFLDIYAEIKKSGKPFCAKWPQERIYAVRLLQYCMYDDYPRNLFQRQNNHMIENTHTRGESDAQVALIAKN
jgi:hypothetical protein